MAKNIIVEIDGKETKVVLASQHIAEISELKKQKESALATAKEEAIDEYKNSDEFKTMFSQFQEYKLKDTKQKFIENEFYKNINESGAFGKVILEENINWEADEKEIESQLKKYSSQLIKDNPKLPVPNRTDDDDEPNNQIGILGLESAGTTNVEKPTLVLGLGD